MRTGMQLFEQRGFRETTIQDICDAVGVTKGAFYYHFASKEELLMEIHQRYIDGLLQDQARILASSDPPSEKILHIMELLMESIGTNRASAKIFFAELRQLGQERLQTITKKRLQFRKTLELVVHQGIDDGTFLRDLDAKLITMGILGMTNWSYQWFQPGGSMDAKAVAAIFHRLAMAGILSDEGR